MFRILCGTEIFLLTACKFLQYAAGHTAPPDPGEGLRPCCDLHFGQLRTVAWIVGLQIMYPLP